MGLIQLVITDLDGTFLDKGNQPNERNREALLACQKKGIPVCAITARAFTVSRRAMALGGFAGHCVTSNGASLYEIASGEALYRQTILKQNTASILRLCQTVPSDVFVIARGANVLCKTLQHTGRYLPKEGMDGWPASHRAVRIVTDTVEQAIEEIGDDAELICMHAPGGFDGEFYRSIIELGELSLTSSHRGGFDVMAGGVSKSAGAQRLAELMGVKPEAVMACGDHNNDIGMLRWAGIGVAMGDAHERTRAAADYVSVDHDKGGVADAIYRFVL